MQTLPAKFNWSSSFRLMWSLEQVCKNVIIACDKAYYRPLEVNTLLGDSKKARSKLKWKPNTNLNQLVDEMIEKELNYLK